MPDTFLNYQILGRLVSLCIGIVIFVFTLGFVGSVVAYLYKKIENMFNKEDQKIDPYQEQDKKPQQTSSQRKTMNDWPVCEVCGKPSQHMINDIYQFPKKGTVCSKPTESSPHYLCNDHNRESVQYKIGF